jgi:hypothetical protein
MRWVCWASSSLVPKAGSATCQMGSFLTGQTPSEQVSPPPPLCTLESFPDLIFHYKTKILGCFLDFISVCELHTVWLGVPGVRKRYQYFGIASGVRYPANADSFPV